MKYTFVKKDQLCRSEQRNEIAESKNLNVCLRAASILFASFLLASCGDDNKNAGGTVEDGEVVAIVDKTVSGVSQKGPFVNGSSVTVQELDGETLAQTGLGFEGKIKNDMGEFSVKVNKLESQYALLKANGFYRNEVTGEKSKSQVTLYALTDLSNRDEVNVNLLTHLAYERSLYLATGKDSMSVASAKKQAESEVFKSLGIEGDFATAEDLNIFGESDQSAALLAVSILMQSDLSEGDFSERLADYAADIEADGVWDDSKTATKIADWANAQWLALGLVKIRENITNWNLSVDVPEFEKYVNNFWWQNYGLGTCDKKREGEVLKNQNKSSVNADEYYICKLGAWKVASGIEKDTYKWTSSKDADTRYGDVVKRCYVYEDDVWRSGDRNDCLLGLGGCTKLRQGTVGMGADGRWYVCDNRDWLMASVYEVDTFGWKDSIDGTMKKGNVTDYVYIFDVSRWRVASDGDVVLERCCEKLLGSKQKIDYTTFVCESQKGFFEWVEYASPEVCYPLSSTIIKDSSVEWLYASNTSSFCSSLDFAVGHCELEWSFDGGIEDESGGGLKSGKVFYSAVGSFYASLKISSLKDGKIETIQCTPLQVVNEVDFDSVYYTLNSGSYFNSKIVPGLDKMKEGFDSCGIDLTAFEKPVINKDELCFNKNGNYVLSKITPTDTVAILYFSMNLVNVVTQSTYENVVVDEMTGDITGSSEIKFNVQTNVNADDLVPIYISLCNEKTAECFLGDFKNGKYNAVYTLDYNHYLMDVFYKDAEGKMQPLLWNERRIVNSTGIDTLYVTVSANNASGSQSVFDIGVKGQSDKLHLFFGNLE